MKIAFLTEYNKIGGGEKNLFYLAKELSKTVEVSVFSPQGDLADLLKEHTISHHELKGYMGSRWFKMLPLISYKPKLYAKLSQYDIIHCYSANITAQLLLFNGKKVWTVHGYWEKPYGLKAKIINQFFNQVIAVSNDVKSICSFPDKKIQTVFLGVPLPKKRITFHERKIGLPTIEILSIGRFQHIKGQDLLVKAMQSLAKRKPEIHFTLNFVGELNSTSKEDIEYKKTLDQLVNSTEFQTLTICFKGFQKNVSQFIQSADFIIVPSRYESFSIVTVESLMQGKPVLAPFIGGLKDILKDKKVGATFEADNQNSLEEGILMMVKNLKSYDAEYIATYAKKFSIQEQAKNHLSLYSQLNKA